MEVLLLIKWLWERGKYNYICAKLKWWISWYILHAGNKTLSVESWEPFCSTLLLECYLEKDLSKGVSLEDELFCDYQSHEDEELG